MPVALISGPFISGVFLTLIALYAIIKIVINKESRFILKDKVIILFILFNLYIIVSSFLSQNILESLSSSLFYFRFIFFSIGIYFLLDENILLLKYFLYIGMTSLSLLFIDSIFQLVVGFNLLGFPYDAGRVSSFFGDELIMGSYCVRLLGIFLICIFISFKTEKTQRFYAIPLIIVSSILIIISAERTAILYVILFLTLLFFYLPNLRKFYLPGLLLTISFVIVITLYDFSIFERIFFKTFQQIFLVDNLSIQFFSFEHHQLFKKALLMFFDNSIIGVGPGLFENTCFNYITNAEAFCSNHPHNSYLQLLSESGVIGLLFIFSFLVYLVLQLTLYKSYNNKYYEKNLFIYNLVLLIMFINIWPITPNGNFFGSFINIFYYLPVGFYLFIKNKMNISL